MSSRARISTRIFTGAVCLVLASLAPWGIGSAFLFQNSTTEYSADLKLHGGEATVSGRIFGTPGHQRMEIDSEHIDHPVVVISDVEENKAWVLDPTTKTYREHVLDQMPVQFRRADWSKLNRTEVGRETINGVEATKYAAEGTSPSGYPVAGHMWVSDDGIVVKFAGEVIRDGGTVESWGELSNVVVGPQDHVLFEVPSDYAARATGVLSAEQLERVAETLRRQGVSEARIQETLEELSRKGAE